MNRTLIPALLVLSLAGCAATSDLPAAYTLDAKRQEGLAVVSLTLSGRTLDKIASFEYRIREVPPRDEDAVTAKPYYDSARQHARSVQGAGGRQDAVRNVVVKGPNSSEPLDILDAGKATGRLASLRLPAGEYEFHAWAVREPNQYGGTEYTPGQDFSYRFSIKAGEAVYLGRLHLHLGERNTHKLTVEDRQDRDLTIFKEKYPSQDVGTIAVRIESLRH